MAVRPADQNWKRVLNRLIEENQPQMLKFKKGEVAWVAIGRDDYVALVDRVPTTDGSTPGPATTGSNPGPVANGSSAANPPSNQSSAASSNNCKRPATWC